MTAPRKSWKEVRNASITVHSAKSDFFAQLITPLYHEFDRLRLALS